MDTLDILEEHKWQTPDSYFGFNPVGDYVIYTQTRDSSILEEVNYKRILEDLKAEAEKHPEPPETEGAEEWLPWVYDWRASHWACGWVEYIMIRKDSPQAILDMAGEILCALADYPCYDESAWSDAEYEAMADYWESLSIRDRVRDYGDQVESPFQLRHGLFDVGDSIYESVREAVCQ